jgi:DNA-binding transcriptional regulator YiaG
MTPATFQRIRAKLGMTQTQLAAVLRIEDIRTIRRWERGERAISGPVSLLMELLDDGRLLP